MENTGLLNTENNEDTCRHSLMGAFSVSGSPAVIELALVRQLTLRPPLSRSLPFSDAGQTITQIFTDGNRFLKENILSSHGKY